MNNKTKNYNLSKLTNSLNYKDSSNKKQAKKYNFTYHLNLVKFFNNCLQYAKNTYSKNELNILISLSYFYNGKSKRCFPSYEAISKLSNLSIPTIKRVINRLTKDGFIIKKQRYNTSNIYIFNFSRMQTTLNRLTKNKKGLLDIDKYLSTAEKEKLKERQRTFKSGFKAGIDFITGKRNKKHNPTKKNKYIPSITKTKDYIIDNFKSLPFRNDNLNSHYISIIKNMIQTE